MVGWVRLADATNIEITTFVTVALALLSVQVLLFRWLRQDIQALRRDIEASRRESREWMPSIRPSSAAKTPPPESWPRPTPSNPWNRLRRLPRED